MLGGREGGGGGGVLALQQVRVFRAVWLVIAALSAPCWNNTADIQGEMTVILHREAVKHVNTGENVKILATSIVPFFPKHPKKELC